jgi:hypothetical protein
VGVLAVLCVATVGAGFITGGCRPSAAKADEDSPKRDQNQSAASAKVDEETTDDPRDPFNIVDVIDGKPVSDMDAVLGAAGFVAEQVEARRREMENAAKDFVLSSLLSGSNPLACINGKILRLDGTIQAQGVEFRLIKVEGETAVLLAEDPEFGLTRGEGTAVAVMLQRGAPPQIGTLGAE